MSVWLKWGGIYVAVLDVGSNFENVSEVTKVATSKQDSRIKKISDIESDAPHLGDTFISFPTKAV